MAILISDVSGRMKQIGAEKKPIDLCSGSVSLEFLLGYDPS